MTYNTKAPAAPTTLQAVGQTASVKLTWQAPEDDDLDHYIVLRSEDQQTWRTIHNNVPTAEYLDNTVEPATTYYYQVKAVDKSQNRSEASATANAAATGAEGLICHLPFHTDLLDATGNGNHAALFGNRQLTEGHLDSALVLNGTDQFIQLPATIANSRELTISTWVYWRGGANWQRLFDFGTDTDHYVFMTMNSGSGSRLAIKNGGNEQSMTLSSLSFGTNRWRHVAVTFSESAITVYFDGKQVARNVTVKLRPADFRPVCNYFGRSQFPADPALKANLDDIRIYNYALSADDIQQIIAEADAIHSPAAAPTPYSAADIFTLTGHRQPASQLRRGNVYIHSGRKVLVK